MSTDPNRSFELAAFGRLLKLGAILVIAYLTVEIGAAFLPGGAVDRVLGGR